MHFNTVIIELSSGIFPLNNFLLNSGDFYYEQYQNGIYLPERT